MRTSGAASSRAGPYFPRALHAKNIVNSSAVSLGMATLFDWYLYAPDWVKEAFRRPGEPEESTSPSDLR